ncbi:hypothetical protein G647_07923 [Cladophialophora carrionii CBS 160.54]|uniref:Uncharacterized protein n=1 Tax=Cladophialophora carrionii CBS 160.54 TaxID=1279043 RepID=V9D4I6_9EURO|nr:uncharacterized protein G647_07923 [Cladophialophora carrionii CBS 160.54]ETI21576.1 hypothetical protein G647_07923 [Cladophialophora carrionii CBS 160.54]
MPIVRPRAPEYPRPVSPISADGIPICKDTVVFYDQDGDIEENEEQRAAKRRRIEAHATGYLRGQPVFILTAGLRGPFGDGWQNPWAKQKIANIKEITTSQQSSEHFTEPTHMTDRASPIPAKRQEVQVAEEADIYLTGQKKDRFADHQDSMLSSTRKPRTREISVSGDGPTSRDPKIENWLKTNEAYKTAGDTPEPSPPSPSERKMKPGDTSRLFMGPGALSGAAGFSSSSGNLPRPRISPSKPAEQLLTSFSSPLKSRTGPSDGKATHPSGSLSKQRLPQTPLRQRDSNAQPAWTDKSRAEYAILRSKRTIDQPATAVTDSDSVHAGRAEAQGLCQPIPRVSPPKVREEGSMTGVADVHLASSDASASLKTAQEGPLSSHEEVGPPSLEKEASGSCITAELPSAQLPEAPILPSLPSNFSSHDQMLRESLRHGGPASGLGDNHDNPTDLVCPPDDAVHPDAHDAATLDLPQSDPQVGFKDATFQIPQENTKRNANSLLVSDAPTAAAKTLKVVSGAAWEVASSVGVKKTGALRSRKRQVFVIEEKPSQSIKSALKVAKATPPSHEDTSIRKIALEYTGDLQVDKSEGHQSLPQDDTSARTNRASESRSALRASLQHSTGVSASNNVSSASTKQNAQKQRMLNLIENDDFDLDGAIDDLGSFLDTWDAEKHEAGVS